MAYTLGNKCAKNLCKRTVLLQLIIENVVTCFFLEHSVYSTIVVAVMRKMRKLLPAVIPKAMNCVSLCVNKPKSGSGDTSFVVWTTH